MKHSIQFILIFSAALLLVFTFASDSYAAKRKSKYHGKELKEFLKQNAGVSIQLQPLKTHYIQGQDIFVRVQVTSNPPRPKQWIGPFICTYIELACVGDSALSCFKLLNEFTRTGTPVSSYESVFSIGDFSTKRSEALYGFPHLMPGHYIGYFDQGILSPDFEFDVDPFPDSLQSDWSKLCVLKSSLFMDRMISATLTTMDSLRMLTDNFMSKPVGSLWREEALTSALRIFSSLIISGHYSWPTDDSLYCVTILSALARDPDILPGVIVGASRKTIFRRMDGQQAASMILNFVQRFGRQDLIDRAQEEAQAAQQR